MRSSKLSTKLFTQRVMSDSGSKRMAALAPPSGISLFFCCCAQESPYTSSKTRSRSRECCAAVDGFTTRKPPRAISLKRLWNPKNPRPMTKKVPYGSSGRRSSRKYEGSMRMERPKRLARKKLVRNVASTASRSATKMVAVPSGSSLVPISARRAAARLLKCASSSGAMGLKRARNRSAICRVMVMVRSAVAKMRSMANSRRSRCTRC